MSIKAYKDKEVEKIIQSAFRQFDIVDSNEMSDISASIRNQLDTSSPLTSFTESFRASSSSYRANIRNALIDIIAQLLHTKDLSNSLNQLESKSRQMVDSSRSKLLQLEKKMLTIGKQVKESFEEGLDVGEHHNTMIKDGNLRVDRLDDKINVSNVEVEISPAESIANQVDVKVSGTPSLLLNTGVGSDLYQVSVTSQSLPSSYYAASYFQGTLLKVYFDTEEAIPLAASAKCSNIFRMVSFEGYNSDTSSWDTLGEDKTLGHLSYISTNTSSAYSRYKIVLHNPEYTIEDGKYKIETILHNIKLFKRSIVPSVEKGQFISYPIKATSSMLKTIFDASYTGIATFWIEFLSDIQREKVLVVPKDETLAKWCAYYDGSQDIVLPAIPVATSISVQELQNNTDLVSTYDSGTNSVNLVGYNVEGYLLISFELALSGWDIDPLGPDTNEAIVNNPVYFLKTDKHNNVDGFIFPLSSIPWRVVNEPTFSFAGMEGDIEEIAPVTDGIVEFDPQKNQYYYFNKSLYTNFNIMDLGSDITVEYRTRCDAVRLIIDLTNDATVDEYFLEIIEYEQEMFSPSAAQD